MADMWLVVVKFYDTEEGMYGEDEYAVFPDHESALTFVRQQEERYADAPIMHGARYVCECECVSIPVSPETLY